MTNEYDEIGPKELVESFKKRTEADFDAVIAITGEEGISKSTLATWCVMEGLLYDGFTEEQIPDMITKYTIFSPNKERVKKQIMEAPRYSIINADEAIKILYKLNWYSDIQKFLNMLYALCRKENKISLLCMPRFTDFNEFFRKHRIKFWIHILDRGVGVLFAKDWNPFTDDPWWMKEGMDVIKKSYGRKKVMDFDVEEKINMLSKVRNFIAVVKFEDLPTTIKKIYRKGKDEFNYDDLGEMKKTGEFGESYNAIKQKEALEKIMVNLKNEGYNPREMSKITGYSDATIRGWIRKINKKVIGIPNNSELFGIPNNSECTIKQPENEDL
jgi:hypothetical protein